MASCFARCVVSRISQTNVGSKLGEVMRHFPSRQTSALSTLNLPSMSLHKAYLRTNVHDYGQPLKQEEVKDRRKEELEFTKETLSLVNGQLDRGEEGRLFAVVHVNGKQFIVTQEDIIILHGSWPPTIGDQIKLEKVMLVGGSDFTLIGRPVLPPELVSVTGTIIDKDLSHVKTKFRFRKRKQYRRINFLRSPLTMVRINEVKVVGRVNQRNDVEGLDQVFY